LPMWNAANTLNGVNLEGHEEQYTRAITAMLRFLECTDSRCS